MKPTTELIKGHYYIIRSEADSLGNWFVSSFRFTSELWPSTTTWLFAVVEEGIVFEITEDEYSVRNIQ